MPYHTEGLPSLEQLVTELFDVRSAREWHELKVGEVAGRVMMGVIAPDWTDRTSPRQLIAAVRYGHDKENLTVAQYMTKADGHPLPRANARNMHVGSAHFSSGRWQETSGAAADSDLISSLVLDEMHVALYGLHRPDTRNPQLDPVAHIHLQNVMEYARSGDGVDFFDPYINQHARLVAAATTVPVNLNG